MPLKAIRDGDKDKQLDHKIPLFSYIAYASLLHLVSESDVLATCCHL